MHLVGIIASPRRNGYGAQIVRAMATEAIQPGHSSEVIDLYPLAFKGCSTCGACTDGKVEFCQLTDDLTPLLPRIAAADRLVFSAPIYFGQINGTAKTFLDRLCTFVNRDFSVRILPGKKLALVLTCGAPVSANQAVVDHLHYWFARFFQMQIIDTILLGDLTDNQKATGSVVVQVREEVLQRAREITRRMIE